MLLRGIFDIYRLFSLEEFPSSSVIQKNVFQMKQNDGAFALLHLENLGWIGFFDRPQTVDQPFCVVAMKDCPLTRNDARCDMAIKAAVLNRLRAAPFSFCPQDHGLRHENRITSFSSTKTVLPSVASPTCDLSNPSKRLMSSFEKVTGLTMTLNSVSNELEFCFSNQPSFLIDGLSGGLCFR